ncbi:hypothetical protein KCP71_22100 [Salmonella enterica subsp. enterica]|nr:hypothetical protein KCP71_22100 [Salmonella enterica subsp. enterica]
MSTSASTVGRRKLPPFRCAGQWGFPHRPPAALRPLQCRGGYNRRLFPSAVG